MGVARRCRVGRLVAMIAAVTLAAPACGGGDGGSDELELLTSLDPCSLLTPDAASELSGAAVEPAGGGIGAAIGCAYEFTEAAPAEATGSAIAAHLVLSPSSEDDPASALTTARDDAVEQATADGGDEPEVTDATLAVSPPGAATSGSPVDAVVVRTTTTVRVVYVIETVVVETLVATATVDDTKVQQVVDFTERTVEAVKEAVVPSDITAGDIEGVWTGDWGTMVLEESDGEVRGVYTHDEGTIVGTLENGVVRGWWTEVPSRAPDSDAGDVEFRFTKTADGIALDGRWRYGTTGGFSEDWDLFRSDEPPPEGLADRFADGDSFVSHP